MNESGYVVGMNLSAFDLYKISIILRPRTVKGIASDSCRFVIIGFEFSLELTETFPHAFKFQLI